MSSSERYLFGMRHPSPVSLDSHAAATLRYIRQSMEAAATVTVSGTAAIAVGFVGVLAAGLSTTAALRSHWFEIWLFAAAAAGVAGGLLMARQAARQGFTLFGAPIRKFVLCLAPGLFAGAVMTVVLWDAGNVHAISGSWLLLYGCALISTSAPTTKTVGILGVLFVLLGLVAFSLQDDLQNLVLGFGFGGLHLGFGIIIRQRSRVAQV